MDGVPGLLVNHFDQPSTTYQIVQRNSFDHFLVAIKRLPLWPQSMHLGCRYRR
jgi:hypothetical protein